MIHGVLAITQNLLILGGTTEGRKLAQAVADAGIDATVSLAGRVANPMAMPLPVRVGGFGGAQGLANFIKDAHVTHVIDATHPFAARMSRNAQIACQASEIPLMAFSRPPWRAQTGDNWRHVTDIPAAAASLETEPKRVFLALGRMHVALFSHQPQHRYLLRFVDAPMQTVPLPNAEVLVARGPFSLENDLELLRTHEIDLVISKNSGGTGAYAKIEAARKLGLPVVMIDRPAVPNRREVHDLSDVMGWLARHAGTDRGV